MQNSQTCSFSLSHVQAREGCRKSYGEGLERCVTPAKGGCKNKGCLQRPEGQTKDWDERTRNVNQAKINSVSRQRYIRIFLVRMTVLVISGIVSNM